MEQQPLPDPPYSPDERGTIETLTDLSIHAIGGTPLSNATSRSQEVAMLVSPTMLTLEDRLPSMSVPFFAKGARHLASQSRLDSRVNPAYARHSEVRSPEVGDQ